VELVLLVAEDPQALSATALTSTSAQGASTRRRIKDVTTDDIKNRLPKQMIGKTVLAP